MVGGIATELVRNVFKNRSLRARDSHAKCSMLEKRRWSAVRSYLCGDEYNSVAADMDSASVTSSRGAMIQQEFSSDAAVQDSGSIWRSNCELSSDFSEEFHDSASIRSSEATVSQPILGESVDREYIRNANNEEEVGIDKPNSTLRLFQQEDAATVIQTAFRNYLARRERRGLKFDGRKQETQCADASPESFGTSVRVHIGDSSTDASSFDVEIQNLSLPIQRRVRRAQVLKLQDWDDSTVSSTITRKRIQNRIEAAIRRERALAYAFAQQLRVCSKKKRTKCNSLDSNSSLSWLERWMATRGSENIFMDVYRDSRRQRIQLHSCKQEKIMLDGIEEKESCGSNEVSLQSVGFSVTVKNDNFRPSKTKRKDVRNNNNVMPKAGNSAKQSIHKGEPEKLPCRAGKDTKEEPKQLDNKKDVKLQDSLSVVT